MDRIVRLAAPSRKRVAVNGASKGAQAEDLAADYLSRRGVKIIARNFRIRGGEIDLIGEDGITLVFVEVRLRSNSQYGGAAASITPHKQRRIILAAQHWLSQHGNRDCRFDCVVMDAVDAARIEWIKHAFITE